MNKERLGRVAITSDNFSLFRVYGGRLSAFTTRASTQWGLVTDSVLSDS